jgi:hypothetical protein
MARHIGLAGRGWYGGVRTPGGPLMDIPLRQTPEMRN